MAEADSNIELVSRLLEDLQAGLDHVVPHTIVLPPGSCDDRLHWIGTWPKLGPDDALAGLGMPPDAEWQKVLANAYTRYFDHWAANVAYHF